MKQNKQTYIFILKARRRLFLMSGNDAKQLTILEVQIKKKYQSIDKYFKMDVEFLQKSS